MGTFLQKTTRDSSKCYTKCLMAYACSTIFIVLAQDSKAYVGNLDITELPIYYGTKEITPSSYVVSMELPRIATAR